ncbi:EAL domain-containing protein [Zoogloea sp.]|uniref:bifunctional diguanylate cyclase/phosphodiesterase n=1 Tax=Zoogloea sp. TaxID=49181 RepID=UPI0025EB7C74|nr:EAL domain-containing protein [Zoogloea sp.]MCK6393789.1 EAL domain-containing protein [Zoogloea sp.]
MPPRLRLGYPGFFVLVALAIGAPLAFLLVAALGDLHRQAERDARNVVGVLEARLEATLRRAQAGLEELATDTPPSVFDADVSPAQRQLLQRHLALKARHFPEITGFRLIDTTGAVRYASEIGEPRASAAGRSYFEALRADPALPLVFSEVAVGRMAGRPQLFMAVPIRDDAGRFAGVAMAPLELAYVESLFNAVDLGAGGVITFRRSDDGRLVLRRPAEEGRVNQTLSNNPMHMRVEAGEREGTIRFEAAIDKTERVYAFKRVGTYPFYVAAGIASRDYLAHWQRNAVGVVGATTLFLLLLGLLLGRLHFTEQNRRRAARELQASEDRFQLLLNSVGEGICGIDRDGRHLFSNPAALQILGYRSEAELQGQDIPALLHTHDGAGQPLAPDACVIRRAVSVGTAVHSNDGLFTRADGSLLPVRFDAYPLVKDGAQMGAVLLFADITERRRNEARIEFLAHHDPLTALPNRLLAEDRFEQARAHAARAGERVALLFLDLDGFKTINDSLGHDVGDEMLKALATRLRQQLREADTVCRLGGDEFLVILPGVRDLDGLTQRIARLLASVEAPVVLPGRQLSTSVSIGVALFPGDGRDFTTLMKKADTAMYHAKDAGRNTYRLFDEAMNQHVQESLRLRSNFQRGLDNGEFVLHFQPLLDLRSGKVVGAEALLRWQDPERGLLSPGLFIPVAESSGMIVPLGAWVLGEACRQAAAWRASGWDLMVAVNISAIQFKRGGIEQTVADALRDSGLPAHLLEVELTESTLLHQTDEVLAILHQLRESGVRLSIDDFGTGYSSLAYLKRLAVNKLKIDQSFVRDLTSDPEDSAIVRAIIDMAHSLNLTTIAEGVENAEVLAVLRQFGCDEAQGYYFARPLPEAEFRRYLEAR